MSAAVHPLTDGPTRAGRRPHLQVAGTSSAIDRRLQLQERLTTQVADWLQAPLEPKGVGELLEAEHLYMSLPGLRAAGAGTVTSALHSLLRTDADSRQEFLAFTGISR